MTESDRAAIDQLRALVRGALRHPVLGPERDDGTCFVCRLLTQKVAPLLTALDTMTAERDTLQARVNRLETLLAGMINEGMRG